MKKTITKATNLIETQKQSNGSIFYTISEFNILHITYKKTIAFCPHCNRILPFIINWDVENNQKQVDIQCSFCNKNIFVRKISDTGILLFDYYLIDLEILYGQYNLYSFFSNISAIEKIPTTPQKISLAEVVEFISESYDIRYNDFVSNKIYQTDIDKFLHIRTLLDKDFYITRERMLQEITLQSEYQHKELSSLRETLYEIIKDFNLKKEYTKLTPLYNNYEKARLYYDYVNTKVDFPTINETLPQKYSHTIWYLYLICAFHLKRLYTILVQLKSKPKIDTEDLFNEFIIDSNKHLNLKKTDDEFTLFEYFIKKIYSIYFGDFNLETSSYYADYIIKNNITYSKTSKAPHIELCFADFVTKRLDELKKEKVYIKDSDFYNACNLSKQTFSQCISKGKQYHPRKNTALRFCVGLRLDEQTTESLLKNEGILLTNNTSDRTIMYCLQNKIYDIDLINNLIYKNLSDDEKNNSTLLLLPNEYNKVNNLT